MSRRASPGQGTEPVTAILDATLGVISRGGVDAVRFREVSAASGVPLGTVTYHFRSREALLRAAFSHFLEENTRALQATRAGFSPDELGDVARYLTEVIRADFADPSRRVVAEYELITYAARDPELCQALHAWQRLMVAELAAVLEPLGVAMPMSTAATLADLVRGFQLIHLGRGTDLLERDLADFTRRLHAFLRAACAAHPDQETENHHDQPQT